MPSPEPISEVRHQSVLLKESIDALNIQCNPIATAAATVPFVVVDATINGGGHSEELILRHGSGVRIIGIDLDEDALARANLRLSAANERAEKSDKGKAVFTLHCNSFRHLDQVLNDVGIRKIDAILFDLGLSSNQFEDSGRGFTFQKDELLLMTFKKISEKEKSSADLTAYQIVNEWDEENIADVIYAYGEERYSRRIARAIVESRKIKPIKTTFELVEIIRKAVPFMYTKGKTHFATKTFQALRITVNNEILSLKEGLRKGFEALKPGGRMAVISFHSIEDRIVKRYFQELQAIILTKKPIIPSDAEIKTNRRARSAKLRILEKQASV
jgi:16S rRNA (cytosine1402-N4)-methyltransferase